MCCSHCPVHPFPPLQAQWGQSRLSTRQIKSTPSNNPHYSVSTAASKFILYCGLNAKSLRFGGCYITWFRLIQGHRASWFLTMTHGECNEQLSGWTTKRAQMSREDTAQMFWGEWKTEQLSRGEAGRDITQEKTAETHRKNKATCACCSCSLSPFVIIAWSNQSI